MILRAAGRIAALGCLLSLFVSGCRIAPQSVGFSLHGSPLAIDDARAERVLRDYLDLSDSRLALRGSARVLLEGPDFKLNRPQRILVERPGRLRFEIIGLFDQIAAMLAINGHAFGFFDASSGQVTHGRVTSSLLWDLAKIDLEPTEVVGALLGAPKPSPGIARESVWLEPDGRLALVFAWPEKEASPSCQALRREAFFEPDCFVEGGAIRDGGEIFIFDLEGRLVELRSFGSDETLRYQVSYEDFRPLAGDDNEGGGNSKSDDGNDSMTDFPNRLTIRSPGAGSQARFVWKRVMLAEELSDHFFEIRPMSGSN